MKNTYTVHADQYSIVNKISDCLQRFVSAHPAHIDILFETKFLFVHLVMCLAADKGTFGHAFRLGGRVGAFETVQLNGCLDTSEGDDCILATDFHYLPDAGLTFNFYIFANGDRSHFRSSGC